MIRPQLSDLPAVPPLPTGYDLREATGADVPDLARTLSAAFPEIGWGEEEVRRRLTGAPDVRATYIVAWRGRAVATASSRSLPEKYGARGVVHWVGTHPDHLRRGLAATLLTATLADFLRRGEREAILETQAQRREAIRLYLRFGFLPLPEFAGEDHRFLWSATLQRALTRHTGESGSVLP